MEAKELGEKIIDSMHWKEYSFIGQGDMIFEGSLTHESKEIITDQILALIKASRAGTKSYHSGIHHYRETQFDDEATGQANGEERWKGLV